MTDPKGLVVNGASVTVTEVDTNVKQTTTTDSKGFYSLTELAVGKYEIAIDAPGFKQFHVTNLILNANGALSANASLLVGGTAETVTVAHRWPSTSKLSILSSAKLSKAKKRPRCPSMGAVSLTSCRSNRALSHNLHSWVSR